ncbi:MAG: phosphoribosylformylglycinamidine synthase subunit PurQ [Dehalococcoidia bacterium]|nr:phosphoribosylformylglycinamidine synthase subunit PurQ [Dehalococcoidia bacterium]
MKFGVVVFPGTWSDTDCFHAIDTVLHEPVEYIWHRQTDVQGFDCIVLPGGFSYGDYLRTGAIAKFAPVMTAVAEHARRGGLVIGICNGFQILCEAGLLPGALLRNQSLQFRCMWTNLRTENAGTPFTSSLSRGQVMRVPISHGDGNYYADDATLKDLEDSGRVVFRYCEADGAITPDANPNGSLHNIAGIMNERGNVLGMMPHPERCCEPLLGGDDGRLILESIVSGAGVAAGLK